MDLDKYIHELEKEGDEIDITEELNDQINFVPTKICKNEKNGGLWISGVIDENYLELIYKIQRKYKFDKIITVSDDKYPDLSVFNFDHKIYNIKDDIDNKQNALKFKNILNGLVRHIHKELKKGKRIFIHCGAGMNRSTTIIIYYMIYVDKLNNSVKNIKYYISYLKRYRSIIYAYPNKNFIYMLNEYIEKK